MPHKNTPVTLQGSEETCWIYFVALHHHKAIRKKKSHAPVSVITRIYLILIPRVNTMTKEPTFQRCAYADPWLT